MLHQSIPLYPKFLVAHGMPRYWISSLKGSGFHNLLWKLSYLVQFRNSCRKVFFSPPYCNVTTSSPNACRITTIILEPSPGQPKKVPKISQKSLVVWKDFSLFPDKIKTKLASALVVKTIICVGQCATKIQFNVLRQGFISISLLLV